MLRRHADQLAELAAVLRGLSLAENTPEGSASPEVFAARLIHRANHHPVRVQASSAAAAGGGEPLLLSRLHSQLLLRDSKVHLLFPSRLLGDEESMFRLQQLAESGAQIRLSSSDLPTIAIYDGTAALMAGDRQSGGRLVAIHDPGQAKVLQDLHTAVWNQAVALSALSPDRLDWDEDDTIARTLHTLGQGYTDARAARELGLSVRTYRRYVADLMGRLRATSRFQAGMRAAQSGLIEPP
ncbi:helix-turn-helix transcriptional regulator [Streptomyces sp. NBC_00388]|uniref:helix-turn-helix transcriptional regulator n=1 Tax=Streptomyces sp. NBC_00388 TaxID=2975735 RepID=UPI002E2186B5